MAWSRAEVEATVTSYFEMLELELRGEDYNKSAHRRRLQRLLDGRTEGAIEYKHQNIGAILIEIGFAWIPGYKPSGNYQTLLREAVVDRLRVRSDLRNLVGRVVDAPNPPAVPSVDDFLRFLTDPPLPVARRTERTGRSGASGTEHGEHRPNYGDVDYFEREARNRSLGAAGESFVLNFERARLAHGRREDLAEAIEHTSEEMGDHAGYDIRSFETSGHPRLIEVKTTGFGAQTPFFVSRNQVKTSREEGPRYHLYRLFQFRREPRLFTLSGALPDVLDLDPTEYRAQPKG